MGDNSPCQPSDVGFLAWANARIIELSSACYT
jgi:hypothetical protein